MIQLLREDSITFKITNEEGIDSIGIFHDIMSKCLTESKRKGFRNMFDKDEKVFLTEFVEQLKIVKADEIKY